MSHTNNSPLQRGSINKGHEEGTVGTAHCAASAARAILWMLSDTSWPESPSAKFFSSSDWSKRMGLNNSLASSLSEPNKSWNPWLAWRIGKPLAFESQMTKLGPLGSSEQFLLLSVWINFSEAIAFEWFLFTANRSMSVEFVRASSTQGSTGGTGDWWLQSDGTPRLGLALPWLLASSLLLLGQPKIVLTGAWTEMFPTKRSSHATYSWTELNDFCCVWSLGSWVI